MTKSDKKWFLWRVRNESIMMVDFDTHEQSDAEWRKKDARYEEQKRMSSHSNLTLSTTWNDVCDTWRVAPFCFLVSGSNCALSIVWQWWSIDILTVVLNEDFCYLLWSDYCMFSPLIHSRQQSQDTDRPHDMYNHTATTWTITWTVTMAMTRMKASPHADG